MHPGGRRRYLALQRGRRDRTVGSRGFGGPEFSPRLPRARSTATQKITVCRAKRVSDGTRAHGRRDHNPHQRVRLERIQPSEPVRVALSCAHLRSERSPAACPARPTRARRRTRDDARILSVCALGAGPERQGEAVCRMHSAGMTFNAGEFMCQERPLMNVFERELLDAAARTAAAGDVV
jgi:hypothetical protein